MPAFWNVAQASSSAGNESGTSTRWASSRSVLQYRPNVETEVGT